MKYGGSGYTDQNNFSDILAHEEMMNNFKIAIKQNKSKKFVCHHINKYNSEFPMWVAMELFTFGMVANLYSNMKTSDQKAVANEFGISVNILKKWIKDIQHVRNLSAHYMRFYNYIFPYPTILKIKVDGKEINELNPSYRIFDIFYIFQFLYLNKNEWNDYIIKNLDKLFSDFKNDIDLKYIGFPKNWNILLEDNKKINIK